VCGSNPGIFKQLMKRAFIRQAEMIKAGGEFLDLEAKVEEASLLSSNDINISIRGDKSYER